MKTTFSFYILIFTLLLSPMCLLAQLNNLSIEGSALGTRLVKFDAADIDGSQDILEIEAPTSPTSTNGQFIECQHAGFAIGLIQMQVNYDGSAFFNNEVTVGTTLVLDNDGGSQSSAEILMGDASSNNTIQARARDISGQVGGEIQLYGGTTNYGLQIELDANWNGTDRGRINTDELDSEEIFAEDIFTENAAFEDASSNETITIRANDAGGQNGGDIILRGGDPLSTTIEIDGNWAGSGRGRIRTDELEIEGGSDIAETFDIINVTADAPTAGMLVSIDPNSPGHLEVTAGAYDTKIAGIISGANGVSTGLYMGQKGSIANGEYPVALAGRVYVWADASFGAITPGDLLTSSPTAGHAMKVKKHKKARGAIVGKAMTELKEGKGYVLVLVNLQ